MTSKIFTDNLFLQKLNVWIWRNIPIEPDFDPLKRSKICKFFWSTRLSVQYWRFFSFSPYYRIWRVRVFSVYDITRIFAVMGQKGHFEENERKYLFWLLWCRFQTFFRKYLFFLIFKNVCWRSSIMKTGILGVLVNINHWMCIWKLPNLGD